MNNSTNLKKPTKILIMGLDNSGKTSILMSLRENTNLLSYFSLKPTKGLSVEEFKSDEQGMRFGFCQYLQYLCMFYPYTVH